MDEQLRILKMVEEGTITAEQGAELMAAMNIEVPARQTAVEKSSYDKKMLRIIVDSVTGDKVNIRVPVGAVRKILKATGSCPFRSKNLRGGS
ncbi:MAG: SHOCT-like domain-containing protein [Eisenbergiella massiliensis]